jgi:hypothetical protein
LQPFVSTYFFSWVDTPMSLLTFSRMVFNLSK